MQINFIQHNLGQRKSGEIVQVNLSGNAANVRLMDSSNFQSYKSGRQHRYYGGLAQKSVIRLQIPHSGTWYVAVDMQGLGGSVRSSVDILPSALPPIQDAPLSSVPSLIRNEDEYPVFEDNTEREFDVFISHASEDKNEIVRPLAHALKDAGLKVWYDEFELRIGDSLRRKIDKGLATSRFGLIILSKVFINKGWANYELDGLITRSTTGEQVLLPIWHNITKKEVIDFSPSLADKLARSTASHTVEEIAKEIAEVIKGINVT